MNIKQRIEEAGHVPGLEAIRFDLDSKFAEEVAKEITALREEKSINIKVMRKSKLNGIIKKHTGLNVKVSNMPQENAMVLLPTLDNGNPMMKKIAGWHFANSDSDQILSKKNKISFKVDLINGRVTGDIDLVTSDILIGNVFLSKGGRWSVKESAAILLHEVGHLLAYYEFLGRMATTNFLLQDFTERLIDVKIEKRRVTLMDEVERVTDAVIKDRDQLMKANTKEEVSVLLLAYEVERGRSELGYDTYDMRGFEAAADQYVSRLGYHRHLATATAKFNTRRPKYVSIFANIIQVALVGSISVIVPPLLVLMLLTDTQSEVYDTPSKRVEVLRKQAMHALRQDGVTESQKKRLRKDIDAMKDIDTGHDWFNLYAILDNHIIPWKRSNYSSAKLQKMLEHLSASELTLSSQKLNDLI